MNEAIIEKMIEEIKHMDMNIFRLEENLAYSRDKLTTKCNLAKKIAKKIGRLDLLPVIETHNPKF